MGGISLVVLPNETGEFATPFDQPLLDTMEFIVVFCRVKPQRVDGPCTSEPGNVLALDSYTKIVAAAIDVVEPKFDFGWVRVVGVSLKNEETFTIEAAIRVDDFAWSEEGPEVVVRNHAVTDELFADGKGPCELALDDGPQNGQDLLNLFVLLVDNSLLECLPAPEELMERRQEGKVFEIMNDAVVGLEDINEDLASRCVADVDGVDRDQTACLPGSDSASHDDRIGLVVVTFVFLKGGQVHTMRAFSHPVDAALALLGAFVEILDDGVAVFLADLDLFLSPDGLGQTIDDREGKIIFKSRRFHDVKIRRHTGRFEYLRLWRGLVTSMRSWGEPKKQAEGRFGLFKSQQHTLSCSHERAVALQSPSSTFMFRD